MCGRLAAAASLILTWHVLSIFAFHRILAMSDLARFEQRKGLGKVSWRIAYSHCSGAVESLTPLQISMIMASGTALFSDGYQVSSARRSTGVS